MDEFWRKQSSEKPLFPDLLWSRPEQRQTAGKLLVIGGNLHAFAAPAEAFTESEKAGAGTVRVILPDAAKQIVGRIMEHVEYAPSTPSGSFNQQALGELIDLAMWADGVLIAGDLGRNSETAILLENFCRKYSGRLTLTKDSVDYVTSQPQMVAERADTLLVLSIAQLQKLATALGFDRPFTFDMDILRFINTLHEFSEKFPSLVIVRHLGQTHAAVNGMLVSTKTESDEEIWRVKIAAHAAVWWMQNPSKPLESLTTAIFETSK